MRLQLKRMIGVLVLPALAAMLVAAAVGTPVAGASEFKLKGGDTFPVTFLGQGLGLSTLLSENLNSVTCHNSHSKGEVANSKLAKGVILYLTGCLLVVENSLAGKFIDKCVPDITTKELDIVPLSKLNGGTKTGVLVLPVTGTELASFVCGSEKKAGENEVTIKVKGSVICESSPIGKLSFEGEIICKESADHGEPEFIFGTDPSGKVVKAGLTAVSSAFFVFSNEKDALVTTENLKYSKEIEQTA